MFFQKNDFFTVKICKYQKIFVSLYQNSMSNECVKILAEVTSKRGVK